MLNLFRRKPAATIVSLYGAIVAQARQSTFYAELGVPDTIEGRFDMIVLHLALVIRRLRASGPAAQEPIQNLFDHFCRDMDHNLREMGVGDLTVPRKMRKFGEAFYGRAGAYDRALDAVDLASLAAALNRNVFDRPDDTDRDMASLLADYARRCDEALAKQDAQELLAGRIYFAPLPALEPLAAVPLEGRT
jgi:cytochrome b pre-mRNA-processing protein 3